MYVHTYACTEVRTYIHIMGILLSLLVHTLHTFCCDIEHYTHIISCVNCIVDHVYTRNLHEPGSSEEHGDGVPSGVLRDLLQYLDGVVGQEVVEDHVPGVPEHAIQLSKRSE